MNPRINQNSGKRFSFHRLRGQGRCSVWKYLSIALVIAVPVMIMFSVHATPTSETEESPAFTGYSAKSLASGSAVSLDSTGALQAGAGTSIYRNIVQIDHIVCPMALNMVAFGSDAYLISSSRLQAKTSNLQVVTVGKDTPNVGKVVNSATIDHPIAHMVTLSASTGLFVGICINYEPYVAKADFLVAGSVDPVTHVISPLTVSEHYGGLPSYHPRITRLSDTEFAIAYYVHDPQKLMTRYGRVDPITRSITLSEPVAFHASPIYSFFDLVSLTSSTYALLYSACLSNRAISGPLYAIFATVTAGVVYLSDVTTLEGSAEMAIYKMASARVSDTSALVVLACRDLHGMTAQLIHVENGKIVFGSSLLLYKPSWEKVRYFQPMHKLDVAMISDDSKFLVLFSNFFNNNAVTAIPFQINVHQKIVMIAPTFVLSNVKNGWSEFGAAAIAVSSSTPRASRACFVMASIDNGCRVKSTLKLALMETLPDGVTAWESNGELYAAGRAVEVCTTGVHGGWASRFDRASLTTDAVYFTNTMGTIMKSTILHSEEGGEKNNNGGYYLDAASNTLMSAASRVGYAVSPDVLGVGFSRNHSPDTFALSAGALQVGAGTFLYRDITNVDIACSHYLDMIAVGRDAYLISSSRMLLGATTDLQVITVRKDIPYTKNVVSSVTLQQTIAHIVSLSACTGLFVGIGATAVNDLYVVTGIVDPVTRVINLFNVSAHYGRNFSPMITRLSDTEFAIAYSTMSSQLMTRYGRIDPASGIIVLSDEVVFQTKISFSNFFDILGLTSNTYVLFFAEGVHRPLQAILATVRAGAVSLAETTIGSDAVATFRLASARVSDTSAVVVFAEYHKGFKKCALRAQLIHIMSGQIVFGSWLPLLDIPGNPLPQYGMLDVDVAVTSDDGKFLVLFQDINKQFAMTAFLAQINLLKEIEPVSPPILLKNGDGSDYLYTSCDIAVSSSKPQDGRTGIIFAASNADCGSKPITNFALLETTL